jgi:hypothetical protein
MRTLILLFFIAITTPVIGQSIFCLESGNNHSFFTDLQGALDAAQNGDRIYLPGGTFPGVTIDKEVHLVGVGYFADSTDATGATYLGATYIVTGADNGTIEGVKFYGTVSFGTSTSNQEVHGFSFKRVSFQGTLALGMEPSTATNIVINECVINSYLDVNMAQNVLVKNSIAAYPIIDADDEIRFDNNIFTTTGNYVIGNVSNATFENNIFLKNGTICSFGGSNCFFKNNLFLHTSTANCDGPQSMNNIFGVPLADIFVNVPVAGYNPSYDYHLKPTCPGVDAGSDGTDMGIYGGSHPFKEGTVPYNPHVQIKQIDNQTNGQGELPVNVRVAAQDR